MKLHRVVIRNFRGVKEHAVEFAESGVTVVEGDNGAGKSSLMDAVALILEYPHDSQAKPIREIKPANEDVGAEIEIEASFGPFRLTYKKRYHRDRSTTLEIHEPNRENLTGRDAHDRMEQIFEQNVDVPLFWALWWEQGVALEQADLSEQTSLGAALDQTAGQVMGAEPEDSIFHRVRDESERYFTPTGRTNATVQSWIDEHEAAAARVQDLEMRLTELDETVELCATLVSSLAELGTVRAEQSVREEELGKQWKTLEAQAQEVERLNLAAELANSTLTSAESDLTIRKESVEAVETAQQILDEWQAKAEVAAPSLANAVQAASRTEQSVDAARSAFRSADEHLRHREADYEYFRDRLDVETMSERRDRVSEALLAAKRADFFLEVCAINDDILVDLEQLHSTVLRAQARLEGESAKVEITSHREQRIELDGSPEELIPSQTLSRTVEGTLIISLPTILDVTVSSGSGTAGMAEQLERAEEELQLKLEAAQVTDIAHARSVNRERSEAERKAERAHETLSRDLRDLTTEQLSDRVESLVNKTDRYESERTSTVPIATGLDDARGARDGAASQMKSCQTALADAEGNHAVDEQTLQQVKETQTELGVQLRIASEKLHDAKSALETARNTESDDEIEQRQTRLKGEADAAGKAHSDAADGLRSSNPDGVRAEYETAIAVTRRLDQEIRDAEDRLREAQVFLSVRGEEGLHDELGEATALLTQTKRQRESGEARAAASELLYETMSRHRDEARHAYLAPLQEKIESLGRIVFGPGFSVELHDDLRVARAAVNDVVLDFDLLSTGEREQLGVISRLACASLVSPDGGVPFILDDALGWTDPGRLERIGAALTVGSRSCQVIALTCTPGRYRHVDAASVVHLP